MLPRHALARLRARRGLRSLTALQLPSLPPRHVPPFQATAFSTAADLRNSQSATPSHSSDLRAVFDLPNASSPSSSRSLQPSGLFLHRSLQTPSALISLASDTIIRARRLVSRISQARESGPEEMRQVVKNFDRLSDMLCGVIDMAELIRHAHPDPEWIHASNEAYEMLCSYMNVLNTHTGLYDVIVAVMSDQSIVSSFSAEEHAVALIFIRDFERSGIDLPPTERTRFVTLSDDILVLGRQFLNEISSPKSYVDIAMADLEISMSSEPTAIASFKRHLSRFTRKVRIKGGSWEAQMILHHCDNPAIRRDVYIAGNKENAPHVHTLEALLRARAALSKLVGKESYAEMTLTDKMARTPENVLHFLKVLGEHHRPQALAEISQLATGASATQVNAWDRDYLMERVHVKSSISPAVPSYLSIGSVFQALSDLFNHLFGLRLLVADVAPGEVWHHDVRKLQVVDEDAGVIGWIYADLFGRLGKQGGAAHYTVRCSRRVDRDDALADGAFADPSEHHPLLALESVESEMGPQRVRGKDGLYQLPVAVLSCDFAKPTIKAGATMLPWHEIGTLFHEMGHAIHSMIGQTEYHNVSGTRCATDFVELPSILMEQFLGSPAVMSLFHTQPSTTNQSSRLRGPFPALDSHNQILMATLDQLYHSPSALAQDFSTTSTLANLHDTLGVMPSVPGTAWQTQFGHLYGYGATYYSYLFDQAIASQVWNQLFANDPLNRETGERYKNHVLKHGGGRDPWVMVGQLLDLPEIEAGDRKAMETVGRWGILHSVSSHQ